jgi:hypothetical protein
VRKAKAVNFELIDDLESEPYQILNEMRRFHEDIVEAVIALAWRKNFKPDDDGHLILGKCVKVSDLEKEFAQYDFIILLNREVWRDPEFTDDKKRALVDHELCHAAPALDEEGCRKRDERGRQVWRSRKHDIEEFYGIVNRHGCYKRDLELFAEALVRRRKTPLLESQIAAEERAAEVERVTITAGDGEVVFDGSSDEFSQAVDRLKSLPL